MTPERPPDAIRFGPVKTLLFSAFLTLAVFALAEAGVRIWVGRFREPAERLDVATGTLVLVPGVYPRPSAPPIQINSRGFVGPEFADPPPPGTIRIVSTGDSCTFGEGDGEHTYPAQLEKQLNQGRAVPVQVINAGVEGMNSELALRRLATKVVPLSPHIVTIYLGWNDLMKFDPSGQVEKPSFGIIARVLDRLWLVRGLRKLLFFYIRPSLASPKTGPESRTGAFSTHRPAVFEANLREIIRTAREAGAKPVLLTLASVVSDEMTVEDLRRANVVFPYFSSAYAVGDFVDLIAAYNDSIRSVAMQEGVPLIDLAREIDPLPNRRALFLDTMHPNQDGRLLIAGFLANGLQDAGLLSAPDVPALPQPHR